VRAQGILREGELGQLQFGGMRCRVGVWTESYEFCVRRGVLMFEGLADSIAIAYAAES
jgi:hypothetical protein